MVTVTVTITRRGVTAYGHETLPEELPDCARMRWLLLQHDAWRMYFAERKDVRR